MTLAQRIDELIAQHGSLRAAARAARVDVAYLSRLHGGAKSAPSSIVLRKLGLRRTVTYERVR